MVVVMVLMLIGFKPIFLLLSRTMASTCVRLSLLCDALERERHNFLYRRRPLLSKYQSLSARRPLFVVLELLLKRRLLTKLLSVCWCILYHLILPQLLDLLEVNFSQLVLVLLVSLLLVYFESFWSIFQET